MQNNFFKLPHLGDKYTYTDIKILLNKGIPTKILKNAEL